MSDQYIQWLVTGAQGFVGRYLCAHILNHQPNAEILGVGRSPGLPGFFSHAISSPAGPVPAPLPAELAAAFDNRYYYRSVDLTSTAELALLLASVRPDPIVHLASGLRDDPRSHLLRSNVEGTASLIEAISQVPDYHPKVVLGSSGGVYGEIDAARLPLKESEVCNPVDEYSITKRTAELFAQVLARKSDIPLIIARIFNIIGAGQDERHLAGAVAAHLTALVAGDGGSLSLPALDSTRDFIDVRDVALALFLLATDPRSEGFCNVASGVERSSEEIVNGLIHASGLTVALEPKVESRARVHRHFADISCLQELGFEQQYSLDQSLQAVWDYYQHQPVSAPAV